MDILIETAERVRHCRIDRPQRRNAYDRATALAMTAALREAAEDPACGAILISGTGPCFCAGSDLKELAGHTPAEMAAIEEAKAGLARAIQHLDLPVVAAVHGYALGGGVSLAAACDVVVSDADTIWHMPEVLNGWLPPWGIDPVVGRCGPVRSRQVLWGAARMDAAAAAAAGLVDQICPPGQALETARERAKALARLPPLALRSVKAFIRAWPGRTPEQADAAASAIFTAHAATPAARATLDRFGARP